MFDEEKRDRILEIDKKLKELKKEKIKLAVGLRESCTHDGSVIETPAVWPESRFFARYVERLCLVCLFCEQHPYKGLTETPFMEVNRETFNIFCKELKPLKEKKIFVPDE